MPAQKTPDKGSEDSGEQRFVDYLAECPSVDDPDQAARITAVGVVMRTGTEGRFALRTQDEVVHEIPVEAVESFSALASSPAARFAQLQLNPARLDADLAGRLRAGIAKQPFETLKELPTDTLAHDKSPFETVKEPPQDKQPFKDVATDPLIDKALPKDPPHDKPPHKDILTDPIVDKPTFKDVQTDPQFDKRPFKEIAKDPILDNVATDPGAEQIPIPGGPVVQPQLGLAAQDMTARVMAAQPQPKPPFDTLKEVVKEHVETLKEGPFDTHKEIVKEHLETIKEIGKDPILDTFKESVADTIAENIPGIPGGAGPVVQPQLQAMAGQDVAARAAMAAAAAQPQLKPLQADTLKELTAETLKELGKDPIQDTLKESQFDTLKEVGGGDTWKEFVAETIKEVGKDPILDGGGNTGIADTWVEGIPGLPGGGGTLAEGNPGIPGGAGPVVQPAAGLSPFVLATPHQAPQGALAQQYLAAMAARGTLF